MARVYLARDIKHDRLVAIKVMLPDLAASVGAERFVREIRLAARLTHPHILPLLDSGEAGGMPYYVMPYVDGEDVRTRIDRNTRLGVGEAVQIAREVADALHYAHAADVLHRDIKPENVLMLAGHAVVLDFGVARAISASVNTGDVNSTTSGLAVGTPMYMSPEQAAGETSLDGRSDEYSLAVMLFEMLTGTPPFAGNTAQAVIAKRFFETPVRVDTIRSDVPLHVARAIEKALSRDPADRFPTAGAFAEQLAGQSGEWAAAPRPPEKPSIAVMPFANLGGEPENVYLADGITDEVISALSRLRTLQVAARTSSYAFRGKSDDIAAIGARLKVTSILEGSVQRAATRIRVKARLVSVSTGFPSWSEQFDRELTDVFAIQDEISGAICRTLESTLVGAVPAALTNAAATDVETYELYLKGRFFWNKRTEHHLIHATELLDAATVRDPLYAPAFAGLADAYAVLGIYGAKPPRDVMPLARLTAQRALAIDPSLAEAHATLGLVAAAYDRDRSAAEGAFHRALTLAPTYAPALQWRAVTHHVPHGRFDDAIADIEKARALDPLSLAINATAGVVLALAGRLDEAIARHTETLAMEPAFAMGHFFLAQSQLYAKRPAEAAISIARAIELSGGTPEMWALQALIAATRGAWADVGALRDRLTALRNERYVAASLLARVHLASGQPDAAMDWLNRAVDEHDPELIYLRVRSEYDALRQDPAFSQLATLVLG